MMAKVSKIKNLDVRAIWSGLQDEAVHVNISVTVGTKTFQFHHGLHF